MNPSFLRQRLIRVLTRPPELLYALTRHVFLVILCVVLGTLFTWTQARNAPIIYEGRAQLLVERSEIDVDVLQESEGAVLRRTIDPFLMAQTELIESDAVLGDLISSLAKQGANVLDDDLAGSPEFDWTLRAFKKKASELLRLDADLEDLSPEAKIRRAVENFRDYRSLVVPDPKSQAIEMLVYGSDREGLRREIRTWIDVYKARASSFAVQGLDTALEAMLDQHEQFENEAKKALDDFLKGNGEISRWSIDSLNYHIGQLQVEIYELRRLVEFPERRAPSPTVTGEEINPEVQRFTHALTMAEIELFEVRQKRTDESHHVKDVEGKIAFIKGRLAELGSPEPIRDTDSEASQKVRREERKKRLEASQARIQRLLAIKEKLAQFDDLKEDYDEARIARERWKNSRELLSAQRGIRIRELEAPTVGAEPYSHNPLRRVLMGTFGGLCIGCLFALLLEVFHNKVRH